MQCQQKENVSLGAPWRRQKGPNAPSLRPPLRHPALDQGRWRQEQQQFAAIQDRTETSWAGESLIPATVMSLSVLIQKYKTGAAGTTATTLISEWPQYNIIC